MKLAAFLTALAGLVLISASPIPSPTDHTGQSVWALHENGTHIRWDPHNTYQTQFSRKEKWNEICDGVLSRRKGCVAGVIHRGQSKVLKDGNTIAYVNVEGASSKDMKDATRMRVFEDGTSEDGWTERDVRAMQGAKRPRPKMADPAKDRKALLFWEPADAYENFHHKKKLFWEQTCDEALTKEGCLVGLLHKGETKTTRDGRKTSYVKVEAAPLNRLWEKRKLRVFQDGSTEDFTKKGWTKEDLRVMYQARKRKYPGKGPLEHAPDQSKHTVSWNADDAYLERYSRMRQRYEAACHVALERAGCDHGTIYSSQHYERKPDGTKAYYMVVAAGNHDNPEKKYMKLFGDGSYEWYHGAIPYKDVRSSRLDPKLSAFNPYKVSERPQPKKKKSTPTQEQGMNEPPLKRRKKQKSAGTQSGGKTGPVPSA